MKSNTRFFFILVCFTSLVYSQQIDKIYLKNKEIIQGNVLRVTGTNVEIDPEGSKPFVIIEREDISVLIYSDNTVVNFEDPSKNSRDESLLNEEIIRVNGFRTDGYYYTTYPLTFKFHYTEQITGYIPLTKSIFIYMAIRVRPEKLDELEFEEDDRRKGKEAYYKTELFNKVTVGYLRMTKKEYRRIGKEDPKFKSPKILFETFAKDKIERQLIENHEERLYPSPPYLMSGVNDPPIMMVRKTPPAQTFSLIIGNFKGLDKDVPSADILLYKDLKPMILPFPSSMMEYGRKSNILDESDFEYYTPKGENENYDMLVHRNHQLTFIPDE